MSRQHPVSRIMKRVFVVYGLALAVALVGLHQTAEPVEAECSAVDFSGAPRDCTYTEEVVDCMNTAATAYYQCASGAGYWQNVLCTGAYIVDFWACLPLQALQIALS